MNNYSVSGDFGQVKFGPIYFRSDNFASLDHVDQCGWHRVNELYCIDRPEGGWDYLLIFTVSGQGNVRLYDHEFSAGKDTLFIIPPHIPCRYYAPLDSFWEFYWIHISGENARILLDQCIRCAGERIDLPFALVQEYIRLILDSGYKGIEGELFAARTLSRLLFAVLYRVNEKNLTDGSQDTACRVMEYIENNYTQPLDLAQISKRYYISKEYLIRIFKQKTGMTPYKYYRHLKIVKSACDLEYSDRPLEEIARSIGYSGVSSFSIQFKREMHLSPTEYRKRCRHYHN